MDAGAWLDESFEGYHELGDHLRGTNCLEVRADGKYTVTASDLVHPAAANLCALRCPVLTRIMMLLGTTAVSYTHLRAHETEADL
eukprot:1029827-Rhodomonas_salina.1